MQKKLSNPRIFISKKGQAPTGGQAATLVVIIALLIVFYLFFIPPDVRDEILEGDGENITDSDDSVANETLLLETPGTLEEMEEQGLTGHLHRDRGRETEARPVLDRAPGARLRSYLEDSALPGLIVKP